MPNKVTPIAFREAMQVMELSAQLTEALVDIVKKNPELSLHAVQTALRALASDTTIVGQLASELQFDEDELDEMYRNLN